jgi:phenylalanyl-tRNA synthetase beta chain
MTISYNWLKEYIKADITPEKLSTILTDIGLEVDQMERAESIRGGLEGVVVGEVLTCDKHPDADKLHVTTVNIGEGEPLQIVCGAPNVAQGKKVVVSTIGATLYPMGEEEGFKIKRSKIRGVESFGMLCSERELGISDMHEGIALLSDDAIPGTPAKEIFGVEDDYIYEIGLTPNRVDAASHYGVARDIYAYMKSHDMEAVLALPSVAAFKAGSGRTTEVEVHKPEAAPRYSGVTVTGVKIAPSPEWLQKRLRAIGINPKNNVVDITNFVLHETGHPLHAFDADMIEGGRIVVDTCAEGTPFVTLDGVERKLSAGDLMICDTKRPLCIAGVFGGLGSGVTDSTTNVFIESAYFNPTWVRKTARRHGLNTDSSFRFERGADPNMTIYACKRAALLMQELAGGTISSEIVDAYPVKVENFRFPFSTDQFRRLAGKDIDNLTIKKIISALDIEITAEHDDILEVSVPPYHVDVQRQADLTEEVLRIYGYNNIEIPLHVSASMSHATKGQEELVRLVSDMLSAEGFAETMSNSLTKSAYYENLQSYNAANCVRILNPLSSDMDVMRQTLLFNMLEAVLLNVNHKNPDLKLYEFGKCYYYHPEHKDEGGLAPYSETVKLAITMTGMTHRPSWNVKAEHTDFYRLRAVAEKILARLGVDIYSLQTETSDSDLFGEALSMTLAGKELLQIGSVSTKILGTFDLKTPVYFMEMNFETLVAATKKHKVSYKELSKYPEVKRDLALLVDKGVTFSQLRQIALSTDKKLLKSVSLFDVYEGDKLPAGKKSYALSFVIEDTTKTLTDNVIDKLMNSLISRFERECGATVRS